MIRVLVVEDSDTVAQLLVSMLESDAELKVVGLARDGLEAVAMARQLRPDVITMDVQMPLLDGLAATREIMTVAPTTIIVVSSAANQSSVTLSLDATAAGALMVLPKPGSPLDEKFEEESRQLVQMVRAMSQVKVVRRWASGGSSARSGRPAVHSERRAPRVSAVLIGCSTGGPAALRELLSYLPPGFPLPIVVVQHIAAGFVTGLANWLGTGSEFQVKVARNGDLLQAGTVLLAPDGVHTGLGLNGRVVLSDTPPIDGFKPSITHLFATAAASVGAGVAGVLLTGMGSDGVAGMTELHAAGAPLFVQDEASSVVFGMAQEAIRAGIAGAVLPLDGIASRLAELAA